MSREKKELRDFEDADRADIRDRLAKSPGSWMCLMCEAVFGPDIRSLRAEHCAATPELSRLISDNEALCADCLLILTTPPPNDPFDSGSAPS